MKKEELTIKKNFKLIISSPFQSCSSSFTSVFGKLVLITCTFSLSSCNKDNEAINLFPEGTSKLCMMNEEKGKTILANSDVYITKEKNFKSERFPIFDRGEKKGIGDIDMPDFINMAPEVAIQLKHGYVICDNKDVITFAGSQKKAISEKALVYRVFVDSWIEDKESITGANVFFLLGKPVEDGVVPAWNSNIGTVSWNYEKGSSESLKITFPNSNSDDIEVVPLFNNDESRQKLLYSISGKTLTLQLEDPWGEKEYRLRIRCKRVYTEVILHANY